MDVVRNHKGENIFIGDLGYEMWEFMTRLCDINSLANPTGKCEIKKYYGNYWEVQLESEEQELIFNDVMAMQTLAKLGA